MLPDRARMLRCRMDASRMRPEEIPGCRWVGFGIAKGVTNPARGLTTCAAPDTMSSGLHGELVQPFGGVDASPRCYDRDAPLGFGGFFRWIYLADPVGADDALGVDWCLDEAPHVGVATRAEDVSRIAAQLVLDGIPGRTELALLNCRMCEDEENAAWRRREGLVTIADWSELAVPFFPNGPRCARCGNRTRTNPAWRFCHACGDPAARSR